MLTTAGIAHTLCELFKPSMSEFENGQDQDTSGSDAQITNENQQTLTLDGRVYSMSALPAEAINVLNDLIRSENELNEHRFRMRQLSAAQQTLTVALNQFIAAAGIEPISSVEPDQANDDESSDEAEAA